MNNTLIVGVIVAGVALLFCIIATAIPYWVKYGSSNAGLFRACLDSTSFGRKCGEIEDADDWLEATRAMMILSVLAQAASVLLAILFGFVLKDKQIVALGAAFMSFAAGFFALLGVIIFGAKNNSLHASYGLAVVALILAFVAGAFFLLSRTKNGVN